MSIYATCKVTQEVLPSLTRANNESDLQTSRAIHAERTWIGRAREDVVWLPVDSTNSGIQIVAAARRREENHEQIWAKNKVSVYRS